MSTQTTQPVPGAVQLPDASGIRRAPRKRTLAALLVAGLGAAGILFQVIDRPDPVGISGSWEVAFEEDFSGDRLNGDRWSDHETWESQGYAHDAAWAPVPAGKEQIEVRDGSVVLKARRGDELPQGTTFTTGNIHTRDRFSLPEGGTSYVEARLKAPSSKGLLPAFWLLGNGSNDTGEGWPIKGEVDILEFSNNSKDAGKPFFSVWYPKDVYSKPPGTFLNGAHDTHPDSFNRRDELVDSWHVWGLYRSPEKMEVYIDGVRQFTFRPRETHATGMPLPPMLFTNPMHLRLSLAVGGDWAGSGLTPEQYQEGNLEVDYVRAWSKGD